MYFVSQNLKLNKLKKKSIFKYKERLSILWPSQQIIKENSRYIWYIWTFLCISIGNSLKATLFSYHLKNIGFTSIYKKRKLQTCWYFYSKLYEKSLLEQMPKFFEKGFSKQWGFKKGLNTHQCLLATQEKWKRTVIGVQINIVFFAWENQVDNLPLIFYCRVIYKKIIIMFLLSCYDNQSKIL